MTNMGDDFYIKFAGINYPKDKEPENEFFIGRVGICYEYDPMYDQINKFLDEQTETIFLPTSHENITFSFSLQCVPAISYDSKVVSS